MEFSLIAFQGGPSTPILANSGYIAFQKTLEFFSGQIRNRNTRQAYYRATYRFMAWAQARGIDSFQVVQPIHVAAWVDDMQGIYSTATIKQSLAALTMLFDYLVVGHVLATNPASSVKGPRHIVRKGKATVLDGREARQLLFSIETSTIIGLRDRALIGLMLFSFARIGAALAMNSADVYVQHRRLWIRLQEKGGKRHDMPCHHELEDFLHDYLREGEFQYRIDGPLFCSVDRQSSLTERRLAHANAYEMVVRRAKAAGLETHVSNHTFRATGITNFLTNGGTLETAAKMANHASTRTTQLYDRRQDQLVLSEIERIRY